MQLLLPFLPSFGPWRKLTGAQVARQKPISFSANSKPSFHFQGDVTTSSVVVAAALMYQVFFRDSYCAAASFGGYEAGLWMPVSGDTPRGALLGENENGLTVIYDEPTKLFLILRASVGLSAAVPVARTSLALAS